MSADLRNGAPKPLLSTVGRAALTLVVIGLAAGAASLGAAALNDRAAEASAPPALAAMPVPVAEARRVDQVRVETRHLGVIEPARQVQAAFEIAGTVTQVLVEEGARVEAGQPLARLDRARTEARIAELQASRAALEAQAELARRTSGRQEALRDRGFASDQRWDEARLQVDQTQAQIAEVDAGLRAARIDLDRAELRAPFAGEVAARMVDEGTVVSGGQPVLEIVEIDRPQVRAGLPDRLAARLEPGMTVEVDLDGERLSAAVAAVRPDLDPATRTRTVLLDLLAPPDARIAFGRTVEIVSDEMRRETGFWLPVSALREGERGLWTLLAAEETPDGHVARAEAVEILRIVDERAFVRGTLADGALVVTGGTHKLAPGLRLEPRAAAPGEASGPHEGGLVAAADPVR